MYYDLEWFDIETPPDGQSKVLVMATNPNYQFNHPQLLAGHYIDKYYETPINEFKLTGINNMGWTVVKWAYAPKTPKCW